MWNPFKTDMRVTSGAFNPAPSMVPNDTDSHPLHNAVDLDDAQYPEYPENTYRGNVGNMQQGMRPAYAGHDERVLVFQPDTLPSYKFLAPAPGSTDLTEARDSNSIPGTTSLNYMQGPVTGSAMDNYQEGNRQALMATPPGAYGPVVGGQDYSTIVANATFQDAFSQYSNAASDQAIVSAI